MKKKGSRPSRDAPSAALKAAKDVHSTRREQLKALSADPGCSPVRIASAEAEVALAHQVVQEHQRMATPIDGDRGPFGPGRGARNVMRLAQVGDDGDYGEDATKGQRVVCRKGSGTLARLDLRQRQTAAEYALLVEMVGAPAVPIAGGGIGGGSSDGGASGRAQSAEMLVEMQKAIGSRVVLAPARGGGQRLIPLRNLVDLVCVYELTITAVLKRYGWSDRSSHRKALFKALTDALDRMA